MQSSIVHQLRRDFASAILCDGPALDPSIAELRGRISAAAFLGSFSIYSCAHLRKIDDNLSRISKARLRDDPMQVAVAVESILELLGRLEITVHQTVASDKRIEANRVT
jgi:hypothetical protein